MITSRRQLQYALGIPDAVTTRAEQSFPLLVPTAYLQRMRPGDTDDPLLRQVLPVANEDLDVSGYSDNPLLETQKAPGLLHKYRHRALLLTTASCPVHCRYCFRRHFPYDKELDYDKALAIIAKDKDIHEVILSGGDPLTLSGRRLGLLIQQLITIKHIRRLRIHSRVPVVQPERVNAGMLEALRLWRKPCVLAIHCNHPQEIDDAVRACLRQFADINFMLVNQAVLLRKINDKITTQRALSEQLFAAGVLPYYLHLLDPVRGTAHFAVSEARGRRIINAMRASMPGYLVPRLVREVPNANSKLVVA